MYFKQLKAALQAEYKQYVKDCRSDHMPKGLEFTFEEWLMNELQSSRDQLTIWKATNQDEAR